MSSPDFYLCDICGAIVPKILRTFIWTGRQMDPAGSMEDVGDNIDLCHTHAIHMIKYLSTNNNDNKEYRKQRNSNIIKWVKEQARIRKR